MPNLHLFAVCRTTAWDDPVEGWWIEFYWAEDSDHAREQALNFNPDEAIVCVGMCPYDHVQPLTTKE